MDHNHVTHLREAGVRNKLLPWFAQEARRLPWRQNRSTYRVWVSEIMLQQTRVDTVIPYFQRWMRAFPSWRALADAPQHDVLKCWEGLGYYTRARHLHRAARIIRRRHGGDVSRAWRAAGVPEKERDPVTALRAFPGVGSYTAAAIASLAFNVDVAVVDGNVNRVLCRLFTYGDDSRTAAGMRKITAWANALLVPGRAGACNEAMMELGAQVCLARSPQCARCPLHALCRAASGGEPTRYPLRKKAKRVPHLIVAAAVVTNRRGEHLIAQRRESDMLGGLWEFPGGKVEAGESPEQCLVRELKEELGLRIRVGDFLMTVQHAYSHFTMSMHVYHARIAGGRPRAIECAAYAWAAADQLRAYAYSKADLQVVEALERATDRTTHNTTRPRRPQSPHTAGPPAGWRTAPGPP